MVSLRKALGKVAVRLAGGAIINSVWISGVYLWGFVYNTDNQFGHIVVSLILACLWVGYAVVALIVGLAMVASD